MDGPDELELSREQHRAMIAVDVLRLVSPTDGPRTKILYNRAVKTLVAYLEPPVPDGDEDDGDDKDE